MKYQKKIMTVIFTLLILAIVIVGYFFSTRLLSWYGISLPGTAPEINTIYDAVANKNIERLEQLITEGADVNAPDYRGQAPILLAAVTDQYRMTEKLIDNGADIFAVETMGYNVGIYTYHSHVATSSEEGMARSRVIEKLKNKGFPWPPPWPKDVIVMVEENNWPPKQK